MNRPRPTRTLAIGPLESLDDRIVPSGLGLSSATIAANETVVANKGGQALSSIYSQYVNYENGGGTGTFTPTQANQIYTSGTSVGVDIQFTGGSSLLPFLEGELQGIGMQITATSTQNDIVEGYLPDSQLPVVSKDIHTVSLSPVYKPASYALPAASVQTTTDETLVTNKGGQNLGTIYSEYSSYVSAGSQGTFTSSLANEIYISGTSVGVNIQFNGGNFSTLESQLEGIGMVITASSAQDEVVEGYLPISQLPTVASNGYVNTLSPVYKPVSYTL